MASTITITFETQVLDFSPLTRGKVRVKFSVGGLTHDLEESLVLSTPQAYQFQEVTTLDGSQADNDQQAANFVNSFKRDFSHIGGTKNLTPSRVGNVVTITAKEGTFPSGSTYTGNVLTVSFGTPSNQTPVTLPSFTALSSGIGDCSVIEYTMTASGGAGPYDIFLNGIETVSNWAGATTNIALARGKVAKLHIRDNDGVLSDSKTIVVPRKLVANEFTESVIVGTGSSDLTIKESNPVTGTQPLQFSLDDINAGAGSAYQSSNAFPGILPGTYKLFIKDKFGCAVSRTIAVSEFQDPTVNQVIKNFIVSDFNSLSFSRQDSGRKNYINTLSFEEAVRVKKQAIFNFTSADKIETQFKSSYPFHVVTLFKCDGTKEALPFVKIQENLGAIEKVDCELIPLESGIGVYFDGGNTYTPGTNTIEGASPYTNGLPTWGKKIGQYVTLDTLGVKEITGIGYDSDLNKLYFIVPGILSAAISSKAQATFNRHDYDVYRVDFSMSKVSDRAFVRIEAGFDFDEIDQVWQSETIRLLNDTTDYLKIEWSGYKNLEEMVFVDGIKGLMWIKGRIRPVPLGDAQTYDGAEETYSLEQSSRLGQKVSIPLMTPKQWNKFNLVSGITVGGTLYIEDMELVRTGPVEHDEIGDTNFSSVSCNFAYSGEGLREQGSEIVLNVSTGVVGSGGTGKEGVLNWTGFKRLQFADGSLIRLSNGSFVAIS